jgi:flavin-dependent dehydrogenase
MAGSLSNTDVIIIGAGPSGTSAAIWCALNKLSVLIIEYKQFPRHKPGETHHPGISVLFKMLGVNDQVEKQASVRHDGYITMSEDNSRFSKFNPGKDSKGYQIFREYLDNILLKRAEELGVKILQPCKAISIIKKNERVAGVETDRGIFFARFIIDASGTKQWLSRQLGLEIRKYSRPLFVRYGYMQGRLHQNKFLNPVFSFQKHGWLWTARINPNQYHWTRLYTELQPGDEAEVPAEYSTLHQRGPIKGADVTWRMVPDCAGKGYFLIGDSAAVSDPSSSKGVLRGMYSGVMASHCMIKLLNHQSGEENIIRSFKEWLGSWYYQDFKIMCDLYKKQNIDIGLPALNYE